MLATPAVPSSLFISSSSTNLESPSCVLPSMLTAATFTGIIDGFIFIMVGEPTVSSHE